MPKGSHRIRYDKLIDQVRDLIETQGLTQWLVAERLNLDRTTVGRWCKRFGIRTQRTGPRSGEQHTGWKGGRRKIGGYWYIYTPGHPHATRQKLIAEHRLVMEAALGRYLLPTEVVHHRDGDPENNRIENLEIFPHNSDHLREELKGRVPRWTDDGKRRIARGVQKAAKIRRKLKSGDGRRTRPTGRRPS